MVESVAEASMVDETSGDRFPASAGAPHHSGRSARDSGVIMSDASFASSEAASVASEISSALVCTAYRPNPNSDPNPDPNPNPDPDPDP
jgi:hypothetical protein